jgi:chromosome segregation ATPase
MMYLFVQTWLFLGIAWLVGIVIGFTLARDQKAQRHKEVEAELLDSRDRAITRDKELDEFRLRVAELEGLPEGARASRVAARDEMIQRMTQLERELDAAKTSEKRLSDESERLRGEVDGFRTRYLEARAKWDEYQTKAEALAAAPPPAAPLDLGGVTMMPDDTMRERVMELEGQLAETVRVRDKAMEQIKTLTGRVRELETQPASAGTGGGDSKVLQARIAELEGRLASGFSAARETDALKSRVSDLQDKLSEAEVALSRAVNSTKAAGAEPLKARISELEAQLADARSATSVVEVSSPQADAETARLRSRLSEVEGKLADAQRQAGEAQTLRSRLGDLEQALDKAKRQANEAQGLRAQITSLEARLAAHTDDRATGSEDVSLLKARLADVEARLMSGSQSSVEFDSLRNRVMTLEALLHEAAKSRDEAAILRSKVAELDGRLGQALKAAAETREKV